MNNMFYTYVLRSKRDGKFYTGYTSDLNSRIEKHNRGQIESTKMRKPFELIYFEACADEKDAIRREKYLKTSWGKRYIKSRLRNFLGSI
jgi:putative endonuclease